MKKTSDAAKYGSQIMIKKHKRRKVYRKFCNGKRSRRMDIEEGMTKKT